MKKYIENFKNCLQKEVPFCQSECPFHINALDFIEKLRRGGFQSAFKDYRNAVGFPNIVSAICHAPCTAVCPRSGTDRSIDLCALERACIDYAKNTEPSDYNLPKKAGRIGIIGAGPAGLACALRLATKKYDVVIYEKSDRIGGHLWDELSPDLFLSDIERQFKFEQYEIRFHTEIRDLHQLSDEDFDVICIATGACGLDFGILDNVDKCFYFGEAGVFACGSLLGKSSVYSIADGLSLSLTVDNFLKTRNLLYTPDADKTAMCLDHSRLDYRAPVEASGENGHFTADEAVAEANRCITCKCDACRIYCDLTEFFNKWPLRIRDEVQATTMPGTAEVKATPAKRLISTCNQCGLCAEVCPENIDLGGLLLAARKSMHQQKKAPWPFHDFWIRDLLFSNSSLAYLAKTPENKKSCEFAFFPGCQLGASDPNLILKTYEHLSKQGADVGLILSCCGIPAEWGGDEETFANALRQIEDSWNTLGKPTLLLACPTCRRVFEAHLPHIKTMFVYEYMVAWDSFAGEKKKTNSDKEYAIFDPCSARNLRPLRDSIRTLASKAGVTLKPLQAQEAHTRCCGYGGQVAIANPEFKDFVVKKRVSESAYPYITYCVNCRDIFSEEGKEAVHILDLLFGQDSPKALPTVSERRDNRVYLKKTALKEFWNETMEINEHEYPFTLVMKDDLKAKMNSQRILEEEIYNTIDFCEKQKRSVYDSEKNTYTGYRKIGHMTFWAEYTKPENNRIELVNCYSHRMSIELEAVWNGHKVDLSIQ